MHSPREIEIAFAAFARDYTLAAKELNPYADCDVLELGSGVAVYSGAVSPIHGIYGAGLDGPLEERDFIHIAKFFEKAERAPLWHVSTATDSSLLETLKTESETPILVFDLKSDLELPAEQEASLPEDHKDWLLAHTKARKNDPMAKEPDLYSSVVLHMKNVRLYLHKSHLDAAFTHFSGGGALSFCRPGMKEGTLLSQIREAKEFGAMWFTLVNSPQPTENTKFFPHWTYSQKLSLRKA